MSREPMCTETMSAAERTMREYLLGRGDADAFEARLFADDEVYAAVQMEQDALIDDFLSDQLGRSDAEQFRRQCALSPSLRRKVDDHRALRQALEKVSPNVFARSADGPRSIWLRRIVLPAAACLACVVLVWQTARHRHGRSPQGAPVASMSGIASQGPPAVAAEVAEPTFFLAAGVTRGPVKPPHLKIAAAARALHLQIELGPSTAAVSEWTVEVFRGKDRVWAEDGVTAQQLGEERFVSVHVAATTLSDGPYTVRLSGAGPEGLTVLRTFVLERQL